MKDINFFLLYVHQGRSITLIAVYKTQHPLAVIKMIVYTLGISYTQNIRSTFGVLIIYVLLCYHFSSLAHLRTNCVACGTWTKISLTPLVYNI